MNNILTLGLTPEEATQLKTVIDETVSEMQRAQERIDHDQKEIEASRTRNAVIEAEIQTLLANRRNVISPR